MDPTDRVITNNYCTSVYLKAECHKKGKNVVEIYISKVVKTNVIY